MDAIRRERERLLRRAARVYGACVVLTAFLCHSTQSQSQSSITVWLATVPLFVLAAMAIWMADTRFAWASVIVMSVSAFGIGAVLRFASTPLLGAGDAVMTEAAATTIVILTAGAIPAAALALPTTPQAPVGFAAAAVISTVAASLLLIDVQSVLITVLGHLFGWSIAAVLAIIIIAAVPPAVEQIGSIGRAHRAERVASELEAQRRQGARLLHDTVLATLTLLAHSGVGVAPELLREQAESDARLLRQLRLGETPTPLPGASYSPEPVEDTTLAETLDAMRRRFSQMGLVVSLHGVGKVMLPQHVLDAFLLAVAECLENVRRHAGVADAHVTITEDELAVRAMVTDAGVGFEIGAIDDGRFGIKESVLGRLAAVGGSARLFSSPGAGTTVLLEVPK